jgi:hypothetical protein
MNNDLVGKPWRRHEITATATTTANTIFDPNNSSFICSRYNTTITTISMRNPLAGLERTVGKDMLDKVSDSNDRMLKPSISPCFICLQDFHLSPFSYQ